MEKNSMPWIGRIIIVQMSILPRTIYTFNANPMKTAPVFFKKHRTILKFVWNHTIAKVIDPE